MNHEAKLAGVTSDVVVRVEELNTRIVTVAKAKSNNTQSSQSGFFAADNVQTKTKNDGLIKDLDQTCKTLNAEAEEAYKNSIAATQGTLSTLTA